MLPDRAATALWIASIPSRGLGERRTPAPRPLGGASETITGPALVRPRAPEALSPETLPAPLPTTQKRPTLPYEALPPIRGETDSTYSFYLKSSQGSALT